MDDLAEHVWLMGCSMNLSVADQMQMQTTLSGDTQAEAHQLQQEREQMILHALQDCRAYGAPAERLDVLARECGVLSEWRKLCK